MSEEQRPTSSKHYPKHQVPSVPTRGRGGGPEGQLFRQSFFLTPPPADLGDIRTAQYDEQVKMPPIIGKEVLEAIAATSHSLPVKIDACYMDDGSCIWYYGPPVDFCYRRVDGLPAPAPASMVVSGIVTMF